MDAKLLVACAMGVGCVPDHLESGWLDLSGDVVGVVDVASLGAVRFAPDGPVVADGLGEPPGPAFGVQPEPLVPTLTFPVVDAGERLGVRVPYDGLELRLYLERGDALSWTHRATQGGSTGPGDGVRLLPGVGVEVLDHGDDAVHVQVRRPGAVVRAWVPASHVDAVRDREPNRELASMVDGPGIWLAVPVDLRDAPDGAWLGRLDDPRPAPDLHRAPDPVFAHRRGDDTAGWTPVSWSHRGVAVDGWVPAANVVEGPRSIVGRGSGASGGSRCGGWSRRVQVPAGTLLFDDIDGAVVGEALDDTWVFPWWVGDPLAEGWRTLDVPTPWGSVQVLLEPDAVVVP